MDDIIVLIFKTWKFYR